MQVLEKEHEYAGFLYKITTDGLIVYASPHVGQHPASGKSKHIRAAVETFLEKTND